MYQDKEESYYHNDRPEMLEFVPKGSKSALDVGCSSGNFGLLLKTKLSLVVWGIEPDTKSAEAAKGKLDHVIKGMFNDESAALINRKFDIIFFNDVLEHLPDAESALISCKSLLNPGGVIVASLPNFRFHTVFNELIFQEDFVYQNSGIMDKTHLRFYTKKSMIRLFTQSGYKVEIIKGINEEILQGRKIKLLKFILKKWLADISFLQYAIVARPVTANEA